MTKTRRSLQASTQGIERAKVALNRRHLTQKALSDSASDTYIASWSTISKFFNGKPVDRPIFLDICQYLNLDWRQTVENSSLTDEEPEANSDPLFNNIHHYAQRTRQELEPYILPRIRRNALLEKGLTLIQRSVNADTPNLIPIIGGAGYGKSTILGNLYDELTTPNTPHPWHWIALGRCDNIIESTPQFATELGETLSGERKSIIEIAQHLTQTHGKGILLLDTLDIVLTKSLVPILRHLWYELLETGTTLVFTCRDSDYSYFFEPYHESFAGFRNRVTSPCKIPPFTPEQVKLAAQTFVQSKLNDRTPDKAIEFANKIVALSADSQSLQDITSNPLLLALLCDLFAAIGKVPEDLTVSQLYAKYWDWKIANVRKTQQSLQVSMAKERLCLTLAESMYTQSGERLRDFIYESTLNLNEIEAIAYSELKSDGVLKEIGGKRIIFFHQTFLEYAIARWLYGTDTGEQERKRLESQLNTSQTTYSRYYLWTVLRQLLTLVHLNEFHRLSHQLDTQQILPFRSVAFAAVSRHEPESASILPQLLSIALTKEYSFHEALLIAANSAPLRHGDIVWQVVVKLLEEVNNDLINKATEIAAELLVRLTSDSGSRFQAAINAITQRTAKTKAKKDERYLIFGKLLGTYAHQRPRKNQPIELEVLNTLKAHYTLFGGNVRAIVIDLYLTPHVPPEIQREFLLTILTQPVSESFKEKDKAIELLQKRLPSFLKTADTPFGTSWFTALHAPLIEASPSQPTPGDHIHATWRPVIATVVGYHAASDTDLLTTLMSHLFGEHLSENSGQFVRSNYLAIEAAIHQGAADSVASLLLSIPINTIIPSQISLVSTLLKTLADNKLQPIVADGEALSPSSPPSPPSPDSPLPLALTQWILPRVSQHPVELIRAIDALATHSPPVQQQLAQLLDSLLPTLPPRQTNGIVKKLNRIPPSLEPYLQQTIQSKESRVALVKLYRSQIEKGSHAAMTPLLNLCLDKSRDVAQSASWVVLDFASQIQAASQIAPICVQSPITGVRQNALKALIAAMNGGLPVSETEIETLFNALAEDKAPEVLQLLYELVNCCLWHHHSISQELAQATFKLTQRLVEQNHKATLDMTTKAAFITLNQMLNLEDSRLVPPIRDCTRALLRATDIGQKVDRLIITGILTKLAKYNSELLTQIVREDLVINGRVLPAANLYAIAIAIVHDQGKNAPLLNEILQDERLTNDVKSRILRERGL